MKRDAVVLEARSWLGTPYHHLADVKGAGVDCAMLLVAVYRAVGAIPPELDPRPYAYDWHMHHREEKFLGWLQRCGVEVERPEVGDVAVWRFGRTYSHGAIVIGLDGTIVHAHKPAGMVTLGNLRETELVQREPRFFRVRGVDA